MPSIVACQKCAAKFKALDHLAGKTVKCPKCGGPVTVPGGGYDLNSAASSPLDSFELPQPVAPPAPRASARPAAAPPLPKPAKNTAEQHRKLFRILNHIGFGFIVVWTLFIMLVIFVNFDDADNTPIHELKHTFATYRSMLNLLMFVVWVRIMVHAFRSSIMMGFLMLILPQFVLGVVAFVTMLAFAPWFSNLVMALGVAVFYGGFGFAIHRPAARSAATLIALMFLFMGMGIVEGFAVIKSMRPSINADGSVTFERVPVGPDGKTGKVTMSSPEAGAASSKIEAVLDGVSIAELFRNSNRARDSNDSPVGITYTLNRRMMIEDNTYGPGANDLKFTVTQINADGTYCVTFETTSPTARLSQRYPAGTRAPAGPSANFTAPPAQPSAATNNNFSQPAPKPVPVAKPDPAIFAEPKGPVTDLMPQAGDDALLAPEVGFLGFRFRPPLQVMIDLYQSYDRTTTVNWWDFPRDALFSGDHVNILNVSESAHGIKFQQVATTQQTPWIIKPGERVEQQDAHLWRIVSSDAKMDFVRVSGVRFVRVRFTPMETGQNGPPSVVYFSLLNDKALVITAVNINDANWLKRVEACVRSLRPMAITEELPSPYDPDTLFILAAKHPATREQYKKDGRDIYADAVANLKSGKLTMRMAALAYLAETQPRKHRPDLAAAASDPDPLVARLAARLLTDIAARPDPLEIALTKLNDNSKSRGKWMVIDEIARIPPDDRRERVTAELLPFLDSTEYMDAKSASEALLKWGDDGAVDKMLKIINARTDDSRRFNDHGVYKNAVFFLAARKDPRALPPLSGMIRNYDREAREQMIAFGPAAEKEALKLLRDDNYSVGMEALRILKVIGGKESLPALRTLANNGRGSAMDEAKEAVNLINARLRAEKEKAKETEPAPPPATP